MGLPKSDNWDQIKANLNLRRKSDAKTIEIYKLISELGVSTVEKLSLEVQEIKYKCNEIYYHDYSFIGLNNVLHTSTSEYY